MYKRIRNSNPAELEAIFEQIVVDLCEWLYLETGPKGIGHHLQIGDARVRISGAALDDGRYSFRHCPAAPHDQVILIGVSPSDVLDIWVVPQPVLEEHLASGRLEYDEDGATVFSVIPDKPQWWLERWGHDEFDAAELLKRL